MAKATVYRNGNGERRIDIPDYGLCICETETDLRCSRLQSGYHHHQHQPQQHQHQMQQQQMQDSSTFVRDRECEMSGDEIREVQLAAESQVLADEAKKVADGHLANVRTALRRVIG